MLRDVGDQPTSARCPAPLACGAPREFTDGIQYGSTNYYIVIDLTRTDFISRKVYPKQGTRVIDFRPPQWGRGSRGRIKN